MKMYPQQPLPGSPFDQTLAQIVKVCSPEKVFVLSTLTRQDEHHSVFHPKPHRNCYPVAYQFLVLIDTDDINLCRRREQRITALRLSPNITALVLPLHIFETGLRQGQPFMHDVYHLAWCCYDSGRHVIDDSFRLGDPEMSENKTVLEQCARATGLFCEGKTFLENNMPTESFMALRESVRLALGCLLAQVVGGDHIADDPVQLFSHAMHLEPSLMPPGWPGSTADENLHTLLRGCNTLTYGNDTPPVNHPDLDTLVVQAQQILLLCQKN